MKGGVAFLEQCVEIRETSLGKKTSVRSTVYNIQEQCVFMKPRENFIS